MMLAQTEIILDNIMDNTRLTHVYIVPSIRLIPMVYDNAICGSPTPGGNEDIGYEEW